MFIKRENINMTKKSRIDIIGQNGNTGEHYDKVQPKPEDGRWNWWGLAEEEEEEDGTDDE